MKYNGTDKYCYPEYPGVLINNFNILNDDLLDIKIVNEQMDIIDEVKISPPYSLQKLCDMHRKMFECAFSWAGELRDIDISKGKTRFCSNPYLKKQGETIFNEINILHEELLTNSSFDNRLLSGNINKIGAIISDLNMLHPFREGNGRTLRLFIELFLFNLNININWPESAERWMNASISDDANEFALLLLDSISR